MKKESNYIIKDIPIVEDVIVNDIILDSFLSASHVSTVPEFLNFLKRGEELINEKDNIEDMEDFLEIDSITDEYLRELMEDFPWDLEFIKGNDIK